MSRIDVIKDPPFSSNALGYIGGGRISACYEPPKDGKRYCRWCGSRRSVEYIGKDGVCYDHWAAQR